MLLLVFQRNESFEIQHNSKLKVFTYETTMDETRTDNLEDLLSKFGYEYEVVGKGDVWNGWYGRAQKYIQSLNACDDETYVLFLDGRDVIPNKSKDEFMKTAVDFCKSDDIIFNSEINCCNVGNEFNGNELEKNQHIDDIKNHFTSVKGNVTSEYVFLNFGMMFGKCKNFKNMFAIMNIQPGNDDQGLLMQKIVNGEFKNYKLDYDNELLCVTYGEPKWDDERKMYYNPNNNAYPAFFHFPAKTKWYETCATKLLNVHLNKDPYL
jgi:hypothetical protein